MSDVNKEEAKWWTNRLKELEAQKAEINHQIKVAKEKIQLHSRESK